MIFRQLFESETCTYTYLLADEESHEAILIDPVREKLERDEKLLAELGLELVHTLETHVHADHVTASGLLRQRLGSRSVAAKRGGAGCADVLVEDGDKIHFGSRHLEVRATPGHTDGCLTYVLDDQSAAFTGDTIFIRGCGRTDFQQGDPETLYDSIHQKIFSLPDATKLYPGHDYQGRTVTTVVEEKKHNPRLGGGKTKKAFVKIMNELSLPRPKKIDEAVPANLECGIPTDMQAVSDQPPPLSTGWAPVERAGGVPEVLPAWVHEAKDDVRLVDVREPDELQGEAGHIEGVQLVPLATLEQAVSDWSRDDQLVTICRSGGRSGKAARILENMGFTQVASMRGGMNRWNAEGRPTA